MAAPEPSYAFARRPIWLLGHVVLVVAVVAFTFLGMWQLRRHDDRQAFEAKIESRLNAPAQSIEELEERYLSDPDDVALRRTVVAGSYLVEDEVILQAQSRNGVSGHDVLTPLLVGERAVIIDRGWVPIDAGEPPIAGAEPPAGSVVVTGIARDTQTRGSFGPRDPASGRLARISRVDIDRLQNQIDADLYPFFVQLESQDPAQAGLFPAPQSAPAVGEGPPHLAYAVQWFVFAAVALVGYPVLLWRTSRRPRRDHGDSAARLERLNRGG